MKKYILVFLALLILMTGCKRNTPEEINTDQNRGNQSTIDSVNPDTNIEDTTVADNLPVIDHEADTPPIPGMVRSRITNEWVDEEVAATRPIAIIVPNSRTASQFGLSYSSVLYECNVEGSMTRLMAIWDDWRDFEKIGNIRSARDYYVYWAFEWDAFLIHFGGPHYSDYILNRSSTESIDCLKYSGAYFRDVAKNNVDNAFTNTERIRKSLDFFGYSPDKREEITDKPHFLFAAPGQPNNLVQYADAINAKRIDMSSTYPVTNCYFVYNAETRLYERFQHLSGEKDGPHLDLLNDEQLTFKNIIIQNVYFEQRDLQGYLSFQCHDTTRGGWFFTNGKGIRITWEKTKDYEPTRFYDISGNEIEFNTGKTMILIIQDGDVFIVDGRRVS